MISILYTLLVVLPSSPEIVVFKGWLPFRIEGCGFNSEECKFEAKNIKPPEDIMQVLISLLIGLFTR